MIERQPAAVLPAAGQAAVPDAELAAALAALRIYLQAEAQHHAANLTVTPRSAWEDSGKLVRVGLEPRSLRVSPSWGNLERLRRDTGGGSGVTGL